MRPPAIAIVIHNRSKSFLKEYSDFYACEKNSPSEIILNHCAFVIALYSSLFFKPT